MEIIKIKQWMGKYSQWYGIVLFMVVLFAAHFVWKLSFAQQLDMLGRDKIMLFGVINCTAFFNFFIEYVVDQTVWLLQHVFSLAVEIRNNTIALFENKSFVSIVWSCTAIKQMFVFFCIMFFARGSWKHKAWFVPLGCVLIWFVNILRIALIFYFTNLDHSYFDTVHELSKYVFYGVIFLIWILWDEKLATLGSQKTQA